MAKLTTVAPKEDFIVEINGDYNVPFTEVAAIKAVVAGEVFEVAADGDAGIAAEAAAIGAFVRVMVRGNPTTVNAQALTGLTAPLEAKLKAQGIVVVNK